MPDIVNETETPETPPVVVAEAPVVETPPAPEPEPAPEPPQPDPAEHGNKGKKPWFLERISQESRRAQTAEEQLAAERRGRQEAEALAQRLQNGDNAPKFTPPAAPSEEEIERRVDQRAEAKLFHEATVSVRDAGFQKFGAAFEGTLNILMAAGVTGDDIVADIIAVDRSNAHVLLERLAQDPEKASALVKMNPRARVAELTRLSMTATAPVEPKNALTPKPAQKQVSKAPAPPPPVEPSTSKTIDWRTDEASDADFDAGFREMMKKRSAGR